MTTLPIMTGSARPQAKIHGRKTSFVTLFTQWQDRRRMRAALARLDATLLRDIGIDPMTAEAETAKPFWAK